MMTYSVAKDSSNPLLLKLTLHSLVSFWEPDMNFITDHHFTHSNTDACTAPCTRPSIIQLIGTDGQLFLLSLSVMFSSRLFSQPAHHAHDSIGWVPRGSLRKSTDCWIDIINKRMYGPDSQRNTWSSVQLHLSLWIC